VVVVLAAIAAVRVELVACFVPGRVGHIRLFVVGPLTPHGPVALPRMFEFERQRVPRAKAGRQCPETDQGGPRWSPKHWLTKFSE
jgi:hypothetical protein